MVQAHPRLLVDLGSGDGAGVISAARADASMLCVGLDTDAAAARVASSRAARSARRGGLPNAIFLAADARSLPWPFLGRADELRIVLPWGSLLRSVLGADTELVSAISGALRPGGRARVMVSVTPTDVPAIGPSAAGSDLHRLADALAGAGLSVTELRDLVADDRLALRSLWAKRLGIPARRAGRLLEARRPR